ncbi:MAG: hypothetical protein HY751_03030 [Nitrospinae bacterium]|nr:hypothetical protein [Nitrospinota bacterium]
MAVKPEMAYPSFASATATFAPSRWPAIEGAGFTFIRFEAEGRSAGGSFFRQTSPVTERRIQLTYKFLTTAERDSFMSPSGSGFLATAGGALFEYRNHDGSVHQARLASVSVDSFPTGPGRWTLGPIELLITG